jgi:hypothetical protein
MDYLIESVKIALTAVIGYYAYRISRGQHRVAQHKLRLDLYERRYKIFDAVEDFWWEVVQQSSMYTEANLSDFYKKTAETRFLFGPEVFDYLAAFRDRVVTERQLQLARDETERITLSEKSLQNNLWVEKQRAEIIRLFIPYLDFRNIDADDKQPSRLSRCIQELFGDAER